MKAEHWVDVIITVSCILGIVAIFEFSPKHGQVSTATVHELIITIECAEVVKPAYPYPLYEQDTGFVSPFPMRF